MLHHLTSGHSVSCGCHNKTKGIKDLTGKTFGKLTVEYLVGTEHKGYVIWHCRCSCGNECDASSKNLLRGHKLSCGCMQSKNEEKIRKLLSDYGVRFETQYSFTDLKNPDTNGVLKFDFAIFDKKGILTTLVEYDGEQHFKTTNFSGNKEKMKKRFKKQKQCDELKNEYCKKNGFSLFRIPYTYEEDVEKLLLQNLKSKGVI